MTRDEFLENIPKEIQPELGDIYDAHDGRCYLYVDSAIDGGVLVVAKPKAGFLEYKRLTNELTKTKGDKGQAMRNYALACTAYPDRERARKIYDDLPALMTIVVGDAQELAGSGIQRLGNA